MWIRVDVGLSRHRKTRRLAHLLRLSIPEAVGCLVLFWAEVRVQEPDGELAGWESADVACAMGLPADRSDALDAMVAARWIDSDGGSLHVHEWFEHNGNHMREAEKKRAARSVKASCPRDVPGMSPGHPSDGTGRDGTGEEAKSKDAPTAPAARPESVSTVPTPGPRAAAPASPPAAPEADTRPDRQAGAESPPAGNSGAHSRRDILSLVNGTAKGLRMPATITGKLDVDRVAKALSGASREDVRTGIQLAQRWWKAGCRHEGLIERLVRLWYERRATIANPFAYFNGPQFASIRASQAARMAEDEHAALLALERAFAAEARR